MQAHLETNPTTATVHLSGRLTFAENGAFRRVVEDLELAGREHIVLDLSGVDFIDSAGMGLLLVARDMTAGQGGAVTLKNAAGQVARMLGLAKFGDFFTLDCCNAQV